MKYKTLSVLIGGLLAAQFASAAVEYSYQLTTSANLGDYYTFYDSGLEDYSYISYVGPWVSPTLNRTSEVLSTYQIGTQWYQDVSVKTVETYTQDVQLHSSQQINLYYSLNSSVEGDQSISLTGSLTGAQGWGYNVSASGTPGTFAFADNQFQISPVLTAKADGVALPISSYTSSNAAMGPLPVSDSATSSNTGSWNAYLNTGMSFIGAPVSDSFEAKAAAVMGGSINYLSIRLASAETLGAIETQTWSNDLGTQIERQMISAPVPEPETYAMLLAGLGLIGTVARRRKAKQA